MKRNLLTVLTNLADLVIGRLRRGFSLTSGFLSLYLAFGFVFTLFALGGKGS